MTTPVTVVLPSRTVTGCHDQRRRRRPHPNVTVATATAHILLLLVALPALLDFVPAALTATTALAASSGSSDGPKPSKSGTSETVGGVTVKLGDKPRTQGRNSVVYSAKQGSKDVIYKEANPNREFGPNEVAATRAAGQLISAEGSKMVQHKVGTAGLKDWLQTQKKSPEMKQNFLARNEKPEDDPNKAKLSEKIYDQLEQRQKDVGYVHDDIHSGNIRVHASPSDRPGTVPKMDLIDWGNSKKISPENTVASTKRDDLTTIGVSCRAAGFQFRSNGRTLYRRTSGCGGGVADKEGGKRGAAGGKQGTGVAPAKSGGTKPATAAGGAARGGGGGAARAGGEATSKTTGRARSGGAAGGGTVGGKQGATWAKAGGTNAGTADGGRIRASSKTTGRVSGGAAAAGKAIGKQVFAGSGGTKAPAQSGGERGGTTKAGAAIPSRGGASGGGSGAKQYTARPPAKPAPSQKAVAQPKQETGAPQKKKELAAPKAAAATVKAGGGGGKKK
ncbi:hypothetical protein DFJ73DRAFT_897891 [Zopfochytrium polystomum]|nr:hypothetical protein DFJ73DRAFT_897891 [Zopfochytrium polystomum]